MISCLAMKNVNRRITSSYNDWRGGILCVCAESIFSCSNNLLKNELSSG